MKRHETEKVFKDPVCKMSVSHVTAAVMYEHEGKTYYFCSEHCRDEFQRTPERYVGNWPREADKSS